MSTQPTLSCEQVLSLLPPRPPPTPFGTAPSLGPRCFGPAHQLKDSAIPKSLSLAVRLPQQLVLAASSELWDHKAIQSFPHSHTHPRPSPALSLICPKEQPLIAINIPLEQKQTACLWSAYGLLSSPVFCFLCIWNIMFYPILYPCVCFTSFGIPAGFQLLVFLDHLATLCRRKLSKQGQILFNLLLVPGKCMFNFKHTLFNFNFPLIIIKLWQLIVIARIGLESGNCEETDFNNRKKCLLTVGIVKSGVGWFVKK